MTLSTVSTVAMEQVVAAATGPVWFQLYVYRDRQATVGLVQRAEAAGCKALVLTADVPVHSRRETEIRAGFHLPAGITIENLTAAGMQDLPAAARGGSGLAAYIASHFDPSLTWKDLDWLASLTELPVLVKGIVRADDALRALEHGAGGVIVSNHGGRQLDGAPATIDVLPEIADAVAGRAAVLVDGGVRRGTDVVKAIASGAAAVLIGRPVLWGLAVGGEAGVRHVLELLRNEIDLALGLCGCPTIESIGRDLIR
jgi:4-hydroxymandelate oxidase